MPLRSLLVLAVSLALAGAAPSFAQGHPPAPGAASAFAPLAAQATDAPALPGTAPASDADPLSPELATRVDDALKRLLALRGWQATGPVDIAVQDRAALRQTLETLMAEEVSPVEIAAVARFLHTFGLLPAGVDYMEMMVALLESEVAGYYDHRSGALRLLDDMQGAEAELVLIHELWHALQDQLVGIAALRDPFERLGDASLARAALLEGDATAVMTAALRDGPLSRAEARMMGSMMRMLDALPGMDKVEVPDVPPVVWQQLLFPYTHGAAFVFHLYLEEGWAGVDRSYLRAPRTSREILRPADWLAGWEPTWLETPPLTRDLLADARADAALGAGLCASFASLGASGAGGAGAGGAGAGGAGAPGMGALPPGSRSPVKYLSDVVGMFSLSEMLIELSGGALRRPEAQRATAALAGDRLDAWALDAERDLIVWLKVWDSERAAGAWMDAAAHMRFGPPADQENMPAAEDVSGETHAGTVHERASGEGARTVRVGSDSLLLLERWGDLTLLVLDRGGEVAAADRCLTTLRAAGATLQGHGRWAWPAVLGAELEAPALPLPAEIREGRPEGDPR